MLTELKLTHKIQDEVLLITPAKPGRERLWFLRTYFRDHSAEANTSSNPLFEISSKPFRHEDQVAAGRAVVLSRLLDVGRAPRSQRFCATPTQAENCLRGGGGGDRCR